MRGARCFILWGLVPLVCLAASGCGTTKDTVVASVAGLPVSSQALDHWTSVELAAGGGAQSAKRQALDLLISWKWTLGEAQTLRLRVTTPEARKQLGLSQTSTNAGVAGFEWFQGEKGLKPFLDNPKVSQQDQLTLVRMGMLAARIDASHIATTEAAVPSSRVLAYYRHNRGLFRIGERRDIKAVMNKDLAKVVEAKHEMERGLRFKLIAERFNTSIEGGLRLGRARGTQQKRYEKDYFSVPPHRLVGPLHEVLYYIFEVMSIRPGRQRTLAEAAPTIRRRLAARGAVAAAKQAYEQRWRTRTLCRSGYSANRCGSYSVKLG